ncbi:hypothetical protein MKW98_012034 [Papaver atlanticum]|uniref:Uncharacterized protein n=1 Tax=Papaver atlanticum TaxID=357466 RepID=A0AAD4XFJ3_9MAGN|nr:hypothetical protein MKW98_012034 [Papaver atlanticum]
MYLVRFNLFSGKSTDLSFRIRPCYPCPRLEKWVAGSEEMQYRLAKRQSHNAGAYSVPPIPSDMMAVYIC